MLAQLDAANDLGRAAKVCKHWRGTAYEEELWKAHGKGMPLLAKLKAEPWCRLSWRQLFAQDRDIVCLTKRAAEPAGLAIGPRNELEHYREMTCEDPIPEGCVQATRAMLEKDDLFKRIEMQKERAAAPPSARSS